MTSKNKNSKVFDISYEKADKKDYRALEEKYSENEIPVVENHVLRTLNEPLKFEADGKGQGITIKGDFFLSLAKMTEALGTADLQLQRFLLNQAVQVFNGALTSNGACNDESLANIFNHALAILQGINPKDEIEGMLAIQMVGVHNLAMEMLRRAIIDGQYPDAVEANTKRANKLLRTFSTQLEALQKYRGKTTQQKVIVEHVHVHQGGQAIVGNVEGGSGEHGKNRQ